MVRIDAGAVVAAVQDAKALRHVAPPHEVSGLVGGHIACEALADAPITVSGARALPFPTAARGLDVARIQRLLGAVSAQRGAVAYVIFLLLGWAGGVTLGHVGKLLSLSLWVWWPPGPRPKQDALYARAPWLVEAAAFAVGVELLATGSLAGNVQIVRAGGVLVVCAAALALFATAATWRRRAPAAGLG